MNVADRIQSLRKSKGISQEELADQIGVSRQAVSKWESEQSTPDIEKIILLSDYFEVTTDYLLKGIEPKPDLEVKKPRACIFAAVGTAINVIGLLTVIANWIEKRQSYAVSEGLIFMTVGLVWYVIGQMTGEQEEKKKAKRNFWMINIWILLMIPISCCLNLVDGLFGGYFGVIAPIPVLGNSLITYGLRWLLYFTICILGDLIIKKKLK
ncbi:MAG: helix-turn-helix domain-containing protein [Lachnospiraceae bacterium]|nr:helix-turn-helix domain-containing protein [Lachnospiraceae bacterium]MBD5455606.1 helix-turn-helix domain-containing protein [Lachnospiraceae bacterium]